MLRRLTLSVLALALLAGTMWAQGNQDAPCFTHRGRLSGQNGIAYMVWLVGTKRIVAVHETQIPATFNLAEEE
jgi:hypothetical protein